MAEEEEEEEEEEEMAADGVLDLTSAQLRDLSEVPLPPSLKELDLTANRLSVLDVRIAQMRQLRRLALQQNLLGDEALRPFASWPAIAGVQELVLRDNKLTKIPPVAVFSNLRILDVSFNEISSLKGISDASQSLHELYVSKNEVARIEELEHLYNMKILELGSNRLRVMEGLQNLSKLEELWLGRNRIKAIDMCGLTCLIKISLQSNRLTSMNGFQDCVHLEELYLSHNGISKIEGISTLVKLRVLDVSSNKLRCIDGVSSLPRLEDLWLNDNQIDSLHDIENAVAGSRHTLTTLYLEHNPCIRDPDYVSKLRSVFTKLQQIDSQVFDL